MVSFRILMLLVLACPAIASATPILHHDLAVELDPAGYRFRATDRIRWPVAPTKPVEFTLHAHLVPQVEGNARLVPLGRRNGDVPLEHYRLILAHGARAVTLRYGGVIHHPLAAYGEGAGHNGEMTPGIIGPDGIQLAGDSGWYPEFTLDPLQNFRLTVSLPQGWEAVSQGARDVVEGRVRWTETTPQEEIYLIAGRYTLYERKGKPSAMVYLRTPDAELATRYLDATGRYLKLYSNLIGEYPYAKFALVENFWETGFGMPSFTLLGPRVIRLPFILESSYPHEILHNWWGNGVFLNPSDGNWSEGLTAYLADHLMKEQAGRGSEYRRDQLQAYADYVSDSRDFPLAKFRERHSGATQAVGYSKGLMFFHMLRQQMGDKAFVAGLRRFYRDYRFRQADFDDLRAAFEAESGSHLKETFSQWVDRAGAPLLTLGDVHFGSEGLTLTLKQSQAEAPFVMNVPVSVGLSDGRILKRSVAMAGRNVTAALKLPGKPVCLDVDPRFDLFRRLLPGEQPASLGAVLGANRVLILVPGDAPTPLRQAYQHLAESWSAAGQAGIEVRLDREFTAPPADRPVVLLGWQNRHLALLQKVLPERDAEDVVLEKRRWSRRGHSFVLAARRGGQNFAWIATDDASAVAPLARKVPHYGKYGYLVFEGAAAENRLKGQWPVDDSPLMKRVGNVSCLPHPEPPLAR